MKVRKFNISLNSSGCGPGQAQADKRFYHMVKDLLASGSYKEPGWPEYFLDMSEYLEKLEKEYEEWKAETNRFNELIQEINSKIVNNLNKSFYYPLDESDGHLLKDIVDYYFKRGFSISYDDSKGSILFYD